MGRSLWFRVYAIQLLALLRLAFASAPHFLLNLAGPHNSPVHSSIGTPSTWYIYGLRLLVNIRFQVLFHSPPGVLFTFPSWYYALSVDICVLPWRVVPPASHKVSRVSWYSGSCQPLINFAYGIFTLSDQISQNCSAIDSSTLCSPQPRGARTTVWALSISLAATLEIEVSFFSSGYLDVSVPPVPFHTLWIGVWILEVCSSGFPHSDISGSMDICSSPKLFAAYHVLHRLSVPRHPPCALNA